MQLSGSDNLSLLSFYEKAKKHLWKVYEPSRCLNNKAGSITADYVSSSPVFSLVSKTRVRETRELISRASLFVGPDSGPMHLAASTSTPIVAYFGPTLPAVFSPWQATSTIVEKDFACRPCKQVECITNDFRCLQTIKPWEVYTACLEYLK